jgi:hypothetical protein
MGPEVELYVQKCSICHETPDPAAIPSAEGQTLLARMQANMVVSDITPMTPGEFSRVSAFAEARGVR